MPPQRCAPELPVPQHARLIHAGRLMCEHMLQLAGARKGLHSASHAALVAWQRLIHFPLRYTRLWCAPDCARAHICSAIMQCRAGGHSAWPDQPNGAAAPGARGQGQRTGAGQGAGSAERACRGALAWHSSCSALVCSQSALSPSAAIASVCACVHVPLSFACTNWNCPRVLSMRTNNNHAGYTYPSMC